MAAFSDDVSVLKSAEDLQAVSCFRKETGTV